MKKKNSNDVWKALDSEEHIMKRTMHSTALGGRDYKKKIAWESLDLNKQNNHRRSSEVKLAPLLAR